MGTCIIFKALHIFSIEVVIIKKYELIIVKNPFKIRVVIDSIPFVIGICPIFVIKVLSKIGFAIPIKIKSINIGFNLFTQLLIDKSPGYAN